MASNNSSNEQTQKKGLTKTQVILIVGITLILVAIGVLGFIIYKLLHQEPVVIQPATTPIGNYVVDESNLSEITDQMQEKVNDGMFEVNMNTNWTFSSSSEPSGNAYVANASSNHKPMFFEVLLRDTDEVIYTSTVIPVGSAIKKVVLDESLEHGTYPATCRYNLLDEDGQIASSLSVNLTIVIQS